MANRGWFVKGHDPRRGRGGGKPGRSGRRPDWYKAWCERLLQRPSTTRSVRRILRDPGHPAFATMWKAIADRAYGKPGQAVDLTSRVPLEQLVAGSREEVGTDSTLT